MHQEILSMSLLHKIVSTRHNILLVSIWSSGLCLDTIVVFSCWWMCSVLSLFFSWSTFRISHPQVLSSQDTYDVTYSICCPSMAMFILGEFGFLLTTIVLVFLKFIFIPNCFPTSFILLVNSESFFSIPANNAVSSAYVSHLKKWVVCPKKITELHTRYETGNILLHMSWRFINCRQSHSKSNIGDDQTCRKYKGILNLEP